MLSHASHLPFFFSLPSLPSSAHTHAPPHPPTHTPAAEHGFHFNADVALVSPALAVLDADLAFEVRGPAVSAREARKQQAKYAAAKEARGLLGEGGGGGGGQHG
jgi:hypothetical protein